MKLRTGFLLACATGALSAGAGGMSRALAADAGPLGVPWWFQGYVEAGGRFFLNNPQTGGVSALGGQSLAKYYEYSTIKPGPFLDARFTAGSKDGRYGVDFWARNAGYDDQRYLLDLSKAGTNYLSLSWDQTPHVYSDSAQTLYNGVGSGALTLPPGVANQLATAAGGASTPRRPKRRTSRRSSTPTSIIPISGSGATPFPSRIAGPRRMRGMSGSTIPTREGQERRSTASG
jgi:hypothetical protein